MSEVMPQASAMDIHITVDAQGATSYISDRGNTGVILDLKEKKEEEMDTDKIQPALGQNGVTLNTSYSSDETFLKKADHSYGGDNLPDHERMRNVHLDSEDDSQGSDTMDTYGTSVERNNTIVQIGDNSSVIYHSHNTFILNFSNSRPDNQGMAHEIGHRNPSIPVNVTINTVLKLTSTSETSSSEHKGRRITGLHTRISVPDQPMVETAALAEMQREGCLSRINNFFRNKLGNIFRGSIILDLSPDSVGSLHRILEVIKSGELNNLVLEILQKKEVLENISGTNLKVDIEIVVPEDVFLASGLTMTDIGDLPISKSQRPHGNKDNENIASGITATDHVKGRKIINLVIIGKPGSGKSGLGNIIVEREAFPSKLSGSPVTQSCETMSTLRDAFMLQVTDTPGGEGHETSPDHTLVVGELRNLLKSLTNPVIFILTCRIGRWKEDELAMMFYRRVFGLHFINNLIVVFTGKDDLDIHGKTLEEYLRTSPSSLQKLITEAGKRVLTVSKRSSKGEKEAFVDHLMRMVVEMIEDKDRINYTWTMMEEAAGLEELRQSTAIEVETERKKKEKAAIEENVRENLEQEMKTQRHIQGRKWGDLHTGIRHLQEKGDDTLQRADCQGGVTLIDGKRPHTETL